MTIASASSGSSDSCSSVFNYSCVLSRSVFVCFGVWKDL
uniref:Uncharacterized protein n=1 Tax=Arundo donax TaxID=35708 RepID=A0A0A8XSA0_ARUDO